VEELLCRAVRRRALLAVRYRGLTRVVEPYLIFAGPDERLWLHGWQVGGEFDPAATAWCVVRVEDIEAVAPTAATYNWPHAEYDPDSPRFHRVVCRA
jgi:hypothetical protein